MLVSNFNANTTNYHRKMEAVYETMEKMDLPLRLRDRVNEYYKHVWVEYEALDGNINKFQQELTHTLGIEIGLYKHMNLVIMVPFWKDCTPDFLTQIVLNLDVRVYMPDDYVVRRRETGSEMMMINRGYCKLTKPSADSQEENANADGQADRVEVYELTDGEDDCSDDMSSDDDEQEIFGGGMFGASINSSRFTGDVIGQASDFTDVRRFKNAHGRRPSYPEGTEAKKSKRYREYLHPGQAFGEMSLLMNYKRTANIRAITFVEMCVLSRKDFQNIISRYPEDRRRVLTAMLESCIDKDVIPFPWESIIEAVSQKRRHNGKKNVSRATVIATMTSAEAARILVEAIDINVPDESIKYGFQNFDQEFVEDSSLSYADSTDAKISDTLSRRGSSLRSGRGLSSQPSRADNTDDTNSTSALVSEPSSTALGDAQSNQSLLQLVQSMAKSMEKLQQDVKMLRNRDCARCSNCGSGRPKPRPSQRVSSASMLDERYIIASTDSRVASLHAPTTKEDYQTQAPRKPSLVAIPRVPTSTKNRKTHHSGDSNYPIAILRRNRSNTQDLDGPDQSTRSKREKASVVKSPRTEVVQISTTTEPIPQPDIGRYPVDLSSRSRAARNQTLADLLWKRSNTSGDMLKHTKEERDAARLRRQIRSRRSLPSEMSPKYEVDEENPSIEPAASWLQRQPAPDATL
ncbi:Voltage-gated Ion Channel (VIC) Superfamily [Phytophthora cinnamomi]|uniref:Voltage-gated Ion Channel (VIC) Superfamily n=1 Tax=Phytophthora cinnamomi TaxID=4785 RepID=UPI00355AC680|nr:Voltage-gated Ion Channel (VIC) Superfamily [Phytophthora cinnamomi]